MTVKVNGTPLILNGQEYIVPPLSLGALEQLQDKIASVDGTANDIRQVSAIIDCAHAALKRNYPEMTREQVADLIDIANMNAVFEAVMNVSGMVKKQQASEAATE